MKWFVGTLVIILLVSCNTLQADVTAPELAVSAAQHSISDVYRFTDFSVVQGASSTLLRNKTGIRMTLHTSELVPGDTITIWWVIFNNPAACTDGMCDEDDVFDNLDAQVGVHYAAGRVIGGSGKGNFAAHLSVGDDSGTLLGYPLLNPREAEVHLIVRSHGPAVPGIIPEQIHSFEGGCSEATGGPEGAQGFDCYEPQFAMHQPKPSQLAPQPDTP